MNLHEEGEHILDYYKQKARDVPKRSNMTAEDQELFRQLNTAAVKHMYHDGPLSDVSELVDKIAESPTNTWTRDVLEYYLRRNYWS